MPDTNTDFTIVYYLKKTLPCATPKYKKTAMIILQDHTPGLQGKLIQFCYVSIFVAAFLRRLPVRIFSKTGTLLMV